MQIDYSKIRTASKFGNHKKFLGGGARQWEIRGIFQLDLMKLIDLLPSSTFLDIGCGPGRGGIHFIRYLDKGKYFGFDYNIDFVNIFQETVLKEGLEEKNLTIERADNFLPSFFGTQTFDYALAFLVLNHANHEQRVKFFRNIETLLTNKGRVLVTHGEWFMRRSKNFQTNLKLLRRIDSKLIDAKNYGWSEHEDLYPILEFGM